MAAGYSIEKCFPAAVPAQKSLLIPQQASVRRGLGHAGFITRKIDGFGRKHEMLSAKLPGTWQPSEDSQTLHHDHRRGPGGGFLRRSLNPTRYRVSDHRWRRPGTLDHSPASGYAPARACLRAPIPVLVRRLSLHAVRAGLLQNRRAPLGPK